MGYAGATAQFGRISNQSLRLTPRRSSPVRKTTMSMYESPGGMQELNVPKANQACLTCRKQKRKCNKALPACALCERMNRHCDYSDATPPPTSDDFHALRMKLMELESRLNGGNGLASPQANFATPSTSGLSGHEPLGTSVQTFASPQDAPWHCVQNRFPAIAFLDSVSFKTGGFVQCSSGMNVMADTSFKGSYTKAISRNPCGE